ncbi:hypothetical protein [Thalassiella azotivora]
MSASTTVTTQVLDLQRHAGNQAVGRLLAGSPQAQGEHAPSPIGFPHRPTIEAATGTTIPGTAALDAEACRSKGVPAFTDGLTTFFASATPPLEVAAHESAHQLQHAGLTHDLGLGAEGHAHAVAVSVRAGSPASGLLGRSGARVAPASRSYTVIPEADQVASGQWHVGGRAKVGDQGRTVTTDADTHALYADPALIVESNAVLAAKKSGVRLRPGGAGPSGLAPDGSGSKSTVKATYKILSDEDNEEFYADCGYSAREVQGPWGTDTAPRGQFTDAAGNRQETAASKNPAHYRDEIFVRGGLGSTGPAAHAAYNALSPADKDAFDKKHGINRYAAPGVGEAFTRRRDDELGGTGFNFHWGGVVMVAGGDRITFENYTKGEGYTAKDEHWYFATYGPPSKPGQTWHDQWESVGGPGKGTTIAAATSPDPTPFIASSAALTTAKAIERYRATAHQAEKMALEAEIRTRWVKVTVEVVSAQEGTDEVYVTCAHAGRTARTGEMEMGSGDVNTFWISLDKLFPINGKITVKVYDSDTFSDDDISHLGFDAPYTPVSDNRPWDDAEYHTTVEFDR